MARDESKDIVTVMVPMLRKHQTMLREIHRRAQSMDPGITGDYRVFAAMTFGAVIEKLHREVMPQPAVVLADRMPVTAGLHPASFEQPTSVPGKGWRPPADPMASIMRRG